MSAKGHPAHSGNANVVSSRFCGDAAGGGSGKGTLKAGSGGKSKFNPTYPANADSGGTRNQGNPANSTAANPRSGVRGTAPGGKGNKVQVGRTYSEGKDTD